ncbi:MFS transporter [Escherichia coli]|nr:MFS transporter [Escherichia coli]
MSPFDVNLLSVPCLKRYSFFNDSSSALSVRMIIIRYECMERGLTYSENKTTFFTAAFSLLSVFAASARPIPLYRQYQQIDGVTYYELSLSSVVYFVGAVTVLVIIGRLSDHFGRRNVSLISLLFSAVAMFSLLQVHSATPLLIGRLLQGLSCGLASTALAAWVVDSGRSVPGWVAPAVVSCGAMTGLPLGGMVSGALVEYGPLPRQMPLFLMLLILAVCMAVSGKARETVDKKPGALASLVPQLALPGEAKAAFPCAALTPELLSLADIDFSS